MALKLPKTAIPSSAVATNLKPPSATWLSIRRWAWNALRSWVITTLKPPAEVLGVFVDGKRQESADAGQLAEIVLAETPFYVEGGGQVSDEGYIETETGTFVVENTSRPVGEVTVHQGRVTEGFIAGWHGGESGSGRKPPPGCSA